MKVSVYQAAKELQRRIPLPPGAVNTLAEVGASHETIRVLIESRYWPVAVKIPPTFKGYDVVVELKAAAYAGCLR